MKTPDLPVPKQQNVFINIQRHICQNDIGTAQNNYYGHCTDLRLVLLPRRMYDIRVECNHTLILKSNVHV